MGVSEVGSRSRVRTYSPTRACVRMPTMPDVVESSAAYSATRSGAATRSACFSQTWVGHRAQEATGNRNPIPDRPVEASARPDLAECSAPSDQERVRIPADAPGISTGALRISLEGFQKQGLSGMERVKGIEPSSLGWEPRALPLSYTRNPQEGQTPSKGAEWYIPHHAWTITGKGAREATAGIHAVAR